MSLFERIKLIEKKKDNPDQLNLDLSGDSNKKSKAQNYTDKINKRRNVKNPKYRNEDGSFNQKKYDADKGIGPKGRRAERQNPTTKKSLSQVKGDIEFKKDLKKAGASGDFSPTMKPEARKKAQAIRDARTKQLNIPDPFDVDTSKAAEQNAKKFGTPKPPRSVTRFDNREPFQDDDLGQRTGKTGDKIVNKPQNRAKPNNKNVIKVDFNKKSSKPIVTKPLTDSERIKQNKIETQKADQFKKTSEYKELTTGKDSKTGKYLTSTQRKQNFINRTNEVKNKISTRKPTTPPKGVKLKNFPLAKRSDPGPAYDLDKLMQQGDYDEYRRIKDSTPKGGVPKWMKDFDKQYKDKDQFITNPKRPDVTSIRGSASTNPTPTVKPTQNINKGYLKLLRKTPGSMFDGASEFRDPRKVGSKLKNVGTFRKIRSILKRSKDGYKLGKTLRSVKPRDIARTAGALGVTALATYGAKQLKTPPKPQTEVKPVYDKGTGNRVRDFDDKYLNPTEFNKKYTITKPKK